MDNILFIILIATIFALVFFRKNIGNYLFSAMKICHDSAKNNCSCSCKAPKKTITEGYPDEITEKNNNTEPPQMGEIHLIGKNSFYLASNDEETMKNFHKTPLQDIDPKDLA